MAGDGADEGEPGFCVVAPGTQDQGWSASCLFAPGLGIKSEPDEITGVGHPNCGHQGCLLTIFLVPVVLPSRFQRDDSAV